MVRADTEQRYVKGVRPQRAERLAQDGLETAEDLLSRLPRRYEDRRAFARIADLAPGGEERTLSATVESGRLIRTRRRGFTIVQATLSDESGSLRVVWYNQPYMARGLERGRRIVVFGRPSLDRSGRLQFENPEHEFLDEDEEEGG